MNTHLYVSEVFGPTFQGEGPSLGRRADFVRLMGCNLTCSWCDASYTWNPALWATEGKAVRRMTPTEILQGVTSDLLVITGGEPLLQPRGVLELFDDYWGAVEVETNGTLPGIPRQGITYNVSPKLACSGRSTQLNRWFRQHYDQCNFKFVVQQVEDLDEIALYRLPKERVWVMPEGIAPGQITARARNLSEEVLKRGWNMTTRLQILLWDNQRAH